jgi:hypothetical protein
MRHQTSEVIMATSSESSANGKKWHDMTAGEKATFVGKLFVALCTLGFVYPNVMND